MEILKNCTLAFIFGGALCVIGQLFIDYTKLTPAKILVGYVTVGVILGGLGVYKPLVEIFGCGATVPLTGFGYNLAKGVKEAIASDGIIGIISGGMIPKIECCIDAIRQGVHKVFILDGRVPHAILIETLTDEGIGTMFIQGEEI